MYSNSKRSAKNNFGSISVKIQETFCLPPTLCCAPSQAPVRCLSIEEMALASLPSEREMAFNVDDPEDDEELEDHEEADDKMDDNEEEEEEL